MSELYRKVKSTSDLGDRRSYIGASDIYRIVTDPVNLFLEKTGKKPMRDKSVRMLAGHVLEAEVERLYRKEAGIQNGELEVGVEVEHPTMTYLRAHPDAILLIEPRSKLVRPVDFKVSFDAVQRSPEDSDFYWGEGESDVPVPIVYQLVTVMGILVDRGASVLSSDIPLLRHPSDFRVYRLRWDNTIKGVYERLLELVEEFHGRLVRGDPPAPRTVEDARELWPERSGEYLVAGADVLSDLEALSYLSEEKKRLDREISERKGRVAAAMESASGFMDSAGRKLVTWVKYPRPSVDTDAMKKEFPDLVERFTRTGNVSFPKFHYKAVQGALEE